MEFALFPDAGPEIVKYRGCVFIKSAKPFLGNLSVKYQYMQMDWNNSTSLYACLLDVLHNIVQLNVTLAAIQKPMMMLYSL